MKAVIVEKRGLFKAALTDEGTIIRTLSKGEVGDTIYLKNKEFSKIPSFRLALTYSVLIFILVGVFGYGHVYAQEYSYVSFDINPSIEIVLNRFNKVLSVSALNEIDESIVEDIYKNKIKDKSYEEAINITMETLKDHGYLNDDDNYIMVNISSDDNKNQEKLKEETRTYFDNESHLYVSLSDKQDRKEARDLGMSTGKYVEMKKDENFQEEHIQSELVEHYENMEPKDFFEEKGKEPEGQNVEPANIQPQDNHKPENIDEAAQFNGEKQEADHPDKPIQEGDGSFTDRPVE